MERRQRPVSAEGLSVVTIPIEVHNQGPFVHYPASPHDLERVLARMPQVAFDGLARIQLILGKEYIEEHCQDEHDERDPFTGRPSLQVFPNVYEGPCLGVYGCGRGRIAIHAHVYDPKALTVPQTICELYLRLRALTTFMHELAHHHDEIQRVRRGRWLADRKENVESYAEKMEYTWTREFVLPYLEEAYPQAAQDLAEWVEHYGVCPPASRILCGRSPCYAARRFDAPVLFDVERIRMLGAGIAQVFRSGFKPPGIRLGTPLRGQI